MTSLPRGSDQGGSAERPVPLVCDRCGVPAPAPHPATWTCSVEDGAPRYFCDVCSRDHLRAIEGRLDSTWW